MLEKFLAALVDLLLRFEARLSGYGVQFRLLNLLRETGANGGHVAGVCLFEIAFAGLRRG